MQPGSWGFGGHSRVAAIPRIAPSGGSTTGGQGGCGLQVCAGFLRRLQPILDPLGEQGALSNVGAAERVGSCAVDVPELQDAPVSLLLRIAAVFSLAWAVALFAFQRELSGAAALPPLGRAFANGLGIAHFVYAYVFWYAASAPAANRGVIYAAIMLMSLRTANDLYQLLVLLPPEQALISLFDLVVSVALLVGILESLPRVLGRTSGDIPA
jgi:hypothetical protein